MEGASRVTDVNNVTNLPAISSAASEKTSPPAVQNETSTIKTLNPQDKHKSIPEKLWGGIKSVFSYFFSLFDRFMSLFRKKDKSHLDAAKEKPGNNVQEVKKTELTQTDAVTQVHKEETVVLQTDAVTQVHKEEIGVLQSQKRRGSFDVKNGVHEKDVKTEHFSPRPEPKSPSS